MGVIKFFSSSSHDEEPKRDGIIHFSSSVHDQTISVDNSEVFVVKSSPDPSNFEIVEEAIVGDYLILKVNYPESDNYEGDKILVFKEPDVSKILETNKDVLDPHFTNNPNVYSPIARFRPTDAGWEDAKVFCKAISNKGC